ncbi:hypothetical protein EBB59_04770 [Lysobacter pythonis]|uniref:Uncharacterized protein n=1 Tax=Solilutibacter pythonis TaxID=2483112 RepID=A0A3M2HWW3_9GAMM|nr:hypothetical protein [Lysobacter pythonis]RMH93558.1 hypothetical protein EBB59_04770 [Lysobacter pythonis]
MSVLALVACQREAAVPAPPSGPAATGQDAPPPLRAIGTEPFWRIDAEGSRLRYATPEDSPGRTFETRRIREGRGWRWLGAGAHGAFDLVIQPGTCGDGMSDRVYAYRARLLVDGRALGGCADRLEKFGGE